MTIAEQRSRPDRERHAERLLRASAEHSYDPLTEIDWDRPLAGDLFYVPPHRSTLWGTPLWDQLSHEQRVALTRYEVASLAGMGIWFEQILIQMLIRYTYDRDPRTRHIQYAWTEIADECRHMVMFGRFIDKLDCPPYTPNRLHHNLGRVFKAVSNPIECFAGALIAEEIPDTFQREAMADESLQPSVR